MATYTAGSLALPMPEDSDPLGMWPQIVRDLAEAIELQLGAGSAIAFAPELTAGPTTPPNLGTVGNGSVEDGLYEARAGWCRYTGRIKFADSGTVSAGTGFYKISLPVVPAGIVQFKGHPIGTAVLRDASADTTYLVDCHLLQDAEGDWAIGCALPRAATGGAGDVGSLTVAASNLFTWNHSDTIQFTVAYPTE